MKRWGCWNTEREAGYTVNVRRYDSIGHFSMMLTWLEDRGSYECRYDLAAQDPKCSGCRKHPELKGESNV